jgi:hypothetical protein
MLQAFTLIFAFALLGPPAVAAASDPLLSGYAGPGGGEQSVLGAETLGGGGGGSGGGGSGGAGGGAVATNQSLRATAAPAAPQQDTSGATAPTRSKEPHRSSVERGARTGSRTTKGSAATTANTPARPPVVAYPSRSTDGGGVPLLSGGTVVGLLAGVLTLVVLGLGLRRLSSVGPLADDGRTSQVPTA